MKGGNEDMEVVGVMGFPVARLLERAGIANESINS